MQDDERKIDHQESNLWKLFRNWAFGITVSEDRLLTIKKSLEEKIDE